MFALSNHNREILTYYRNNNNISQHNKKEILEKKKLVGNTEQGGMTQLRSQSRKGAESSVAATNCQIVDL